MTQTQTEILQQPEAIARVVDRNFGLAQECAAAIAKAGVKFVHIAARGTSDHAAIYGKYVWGAFNGMPVALAAPSLHTFYHADVQLRDALVIGLSQSGASTDIVTVLQQAKAQGALTLGITNRESSPLAETCDLVMPLLAGEEKAVAATKTYTTQLTTMALLSVAMAHDQARLDELRRVPEAVSTAIKLGPEVMQAVERYRYMQSAVILSRGFNLSTASEIALKVKEMTYTHTQPYSTADFMHGPLASIDEGFPVIGVAPTGVLYENLVESLTTVKGRGAELLVISDGDKALGLGQTAFRVPAVPEWLSPIVDVIPGQFFALGLALARGYNPDAPRALNKVTLTV